MEHKCWHVGVRQAALCRLDGRVGSLASGRHRWARIVRKNFVFVGSWPSLACAPVPWRLAAQAVGLFRCAGRRARIIQKILALFVVSWPGLVWPFAAAAVRFFTLGCKPAVRNDSEDVNFGCTTTTTTTTTTNPLSGGAANNSDDFIFSGFLKFGALWSPP